MRFMSALKLFCIVVSAVFLLSFLPAAHAVETKYCPEEDHCFLCGGKDGIPCTTDCTSNLACACPEGKPCECYCPYTGTPKPPAPVKPPKPEPATPPPKEEKCSNTCPAGKVPAPYPHCDCTPIKCYDVECNDYCRASTLYQNGTCDSNTGQCNYDESACPFGCADETHCAAKVKGSIYYTDYSADGTTTRVPVKNVKMVFEYEDKDGTFHGENGNYFTYADENGDFSFDNSEVFSPDNKQVSVEVAFEDKDNKVFLADSVDPTKTDTATYKEFAPNDPALADLQIDLAGPEAGDWLSERGKIYVNVLKAIAFKENYLGKGGTIKERVFVYSNKVTAHSGEVYSDEDSTGTGMRINTKDMDFYSSQAPDNREFHEYCHHILGEAQWEKIDRPGEDHGGYANPDSGWGLGEAWAEFCSLEMKKYYGMPDPGIYNYGSTFADVELDYKVKSTDSTNDEELAIAGIMLDLRDSNEYYGGSRIDDEMVTVPMSTIWKAISTKRDFGDGKGTRNVKTLRDFYLAMKAETAGNAALNGPYIKGSSTTALDQIFIRHGAYQDNNGNGKWDEGEDAGYSGSGTALRYDLQPDPSTIINLDARDSAGKALTTGVMAKIEVRYQAPNEQYSHTRYVVVKDGKVPLPVPPRDYPAQITVTAYQGGTDAQATSVFTTTTQEFYQKRQPGSPFGTYTATIPARPFTCKSDYECGYYGLGNKCANSTCTTVEPAVPKNRGNSGCCSAPALLLLAGAAFVFGRP